MNVPMSYEDFIQLVERMRKAQKDYFEIRSPSTLHKARNLEIDVDKAIVWFYHCKTQKELL